MRWIVVLMLVAGALHARPWVPQKARAPTTFQKGISLGLFAWEEDTDYAGLLDEIVLHGATDVELVVPWVQQSVRAVRIAPKEHVSPSEDVLRRTIRQAHERGLRVLLFPILRIQDRPHGEWRGKMHFTERWREESWWAAYTTFITTMARIAAEERAERLSIGSELLKLEKERARWARLVGEVRKVYPGRLLYSANWDHFGAVTFWDLVDEVGMTAYFELTASDSPTVDELKAGWTRWMPAVAMFARTVGKPVIFTEVGYPSLDGANRYPWNETRKAPLDVREQADCYRALHDVVAAEPGLQGFYVWNWFGPGGMRDGDYTPRGKPAAREIRTMFEKLRR